VLGSAVVVRENAAGRRELVGYVVPAGGATLTPRLLYDFLREQVPHYMTPTAYVLLDRLPLFANGKVDRRALPAPTAGSGIRTADSEPPRDDVEVRIAAIWREILEVDHIGVGDDFFVLGGHSLRATQVLSRIDAAFGVAVALREFFAAPTVRGLAERVREVMSWASALEPTSTSALGAATLEL
jgi:acyl carrier protein